MVTGNRIAQILRLEARAFAGAWRRPGKNASAVSARTAALLVCVALLATFGFAMLSDEAAARGARLLPAAWIGFFDLVTRIGASGYIFAISTLLALGATVLASSAINMRHREALRLLATRAVIVFAVAATSGLASQVIKRLVGRARPRLLDQFGPFHFDFFSIKAVLASFPSGHTITAFAIAYTLGLFLPRWRWTLYAIAVLVGISRVVLGSHYPSDVLAGALIGLVSAWLTARAFASRRIGLEFGSGIRPRAPGLIGDVLRGAVLRARAGAGKATR